LCIGAPRWSALVTSGGYGYRLNRSIALAYVRTDLSAPGTRLEVEILGERRPGGGPRASRSTTRTTLRLRA